MITFRQFLADAAVSKTPNYSALEVEEAIQLLNSKCKNALWMLKEDAAIYRSDISSEPRLALGQHGFATVDTSATERKSENTSNYYTVILDNIPSRKDFPKRSRSFIASMDSRRALEFARHDINNLFIIIPFDTAKIGCVNKWDVWETYVSMFGVRRQLPDVNNVFARLGLSADWTSFEEFDAKLKAKDKGALAAFDKIFGKDDLPVSFLDSIDASFSPAATGHRAYTTATLPHNVSGEVWVSGECVLITTGMWLRLSKAFAAKPNA